MTDNPIALFDAAVAHTDGVIAAVRPEQLADPSPCAGWTVRDVINHLVTGNLLFTAIVAGTPPPDRSRDHLGDDPVAAFRDSINGLSDAFAKHDVLSGTYATPIGEGSGTLLVHMRFNELMVHGWDVAKATGQSTDFDPDLVAAAMAGFEAVSFLPRGEGKPFGDARPTPADATAADRLAAFLGREV
ncbi:MAG: TIGR03086 family protein [Actinobacteria bacterium 13_2_20CM_2_71_6]|nr:MAG: TIGR03086 family protein [Actinobacteria bacterium 13_2_20CM_2_71_6]